MLVEALASEAEKQETAKTQNADAEAQRAEPEMRTLRAGDILRAVTTPKAVTRVETGVRIFKETIGAVNGEYGEQAKRLGGKSLTFLDRIAAVMVDPKSGKQKGFLLQTGLDFLGIPLVMSVGDVMGALRGYLNMRSGRSVKGAAEMITALVPGIPTGPTHWLIEKIWSDEKDKK